MLWGSTGHVFPESLLMNIKGGKKKSVEHFMETSKFGATYSISL